MSTHFPVPDFSDKAAGYRELDAQLAALLTGEHDLIANTANAAALLYNALPDLNWAGFYLLRPSASGGHGGGTGGGAQELVLGPFQGKPACVRIAIGRVELGDRGADDPRRARRRGGRRRTARRVGPRKPEVRPIRCGRPGGAREDRRDAGRVAHLTRRWSRRSPDAPVGASLT